MEGEIPDNVDATVVAQSEILLMDLLLAYVDGHVEEQVQDIEDPRELWLAVKAMYTGRNGLEKVLALKQLHDISFNEGERVDDFLQRFSRVRSKCVEVGWQFGDMSEMYYGVLLACALPDEGPLGTMKHLLLDKGEDLTYQDAVEVIYSKGVAMEHTQNVDTGLIMKEDKKSARLRKIRCFKCKQRGHYSSACPGHKKKYGSDDDSEEKEKALYAQYNINWNSDASG